MDKREIRHRVLKIRDAMSEHERIRGSLLLTDRLAGHQWFYRSETILGFMSYGSEIDTESILIEALDAGKKLYLPKIVAADRTTDGNGTGTDSGGMMEMRFYRVHGLWELEEGYKGILEPVGDTEEFVYKPEEADKCLMLMPGVAFDLYRNRIGYGKGFYDRYLADKEQLQLRTIGVGYKCQMVEEIPAEENDIKPYQVICI